MNKLSKLKKSILTSVDEKYFSISTSDDDKIVNTTGKLNVGWNKNYLKSLGDFDTIIDVGAADDFEIFSNAFPDSKMILIDANDIYEPSYKNYFLKNKGFYKICATGNESGHTKFFCNRENKYLSTIYDRNDLNEDMIDVKNVTVEKLDDLIGDKYNNILLKLDIEGSEYQTLLGAKNTLCKTNVIICEISLDKNFPGGNNFYEINQYLSESNFFLQDILRVPRKFHNSYPAQVIDAVYARRFD